MNCIVGVSFSDKGYILDVMDGVEFSNCGLSIINWLNTNKTSFVSEIFKYQDYGIVHSISSERINTYHKINPIKSEFNELSITQIQREIENIDYVYIYSMKDDLLLVKTPSLNELIAIDYKNREDVDLFLSEVGLNEIYSK